MSLPDPIETPHVNLIPHWGHKVIHAINELIGFVKGLPSQIADNRQRMIELTVRVEELESSDPVTALKQRVARLEAQQNRNMIAITELQSAVAALRDLDRPRIEIKAGLPVDRPL